MFDGTRTSKSFATEVAANDWLAERRQLIRTGQLLDPKAGAVTVASWGERFLSKREPELALSTFYEYSDKFRLHIVPFLGSCQLKHLVPSDVDAWQRDLKDPERTTISTARAHDGKATRAKAYRVLHTMLQAAVEDRVIPTNPCTKSEYAEEGSDERDIPHQDDIPLLVTAMPERERLIVLLACWCHLRLGEFLALRRSSFGLDLKYMWVRESVWSAPDGRRITKAPKTKAGKRKVSVPAWIQPVLSDHIERFAAPGRDGLLFIGARSGQQLRKHVFENHWRRARTTVGLPNVRLHDLRHAGGTFAAQTGATTKELMVRLGHSTPQAALRYQHVAAGRDEAIADALSAMAESAELSAQAELVAGAEELLRES
ncbi:MAG: tyrosine-type recombinase/integrase [Acidimicrobiales bacterium]